MTSTVIFRQKIDLVSLEEVINLIKDDIKHRRSGLYFAQNLHNLIIWHNSPSLKKKAEKQAKIIFADGIFLKWLSLFTNRQIKTRVSGTDLVTELLADPNLTFYILGGNSKMNRQLMKKFNNILDFFSPPHDQPWYQAETTKINAAINRSHADIVLVAVSSPKQEWWLLNNFSKTKALAGITVGSALEIINGWKPRAPQSWQNLGFEWLWRIIQEPKRLLPRYCQDLQRLLSIVSQIFWAKFKKTIAKFY